MFKEYIVPILLGVAALLVYNLVVSKLLNMASYEENYEATPNGPVKIG